MERVESQFLTTRASIFQYQNAWLQSQAELLKKHSWSLQASNHFSHFQPSKIVQPMQCTFSGFRCLLAKITTLQLTYSKWILKVGKQRKLLLLPVETSIICRFWIYFLLVRNCWLMAAAVEVVVCQSLMCGTWHFSRNSDDDLHICTLLLCLLLGVLCTTDSGPRRASRQWRTTLLLLSGAHGRRACERTASRELTVVCM